MKTVFLPAIAAASAIAFATVQPAPAAAATFVLSYSGLGFDASGPTGIGLDYDVTLTTSDTTTLVDGRNAYTVLDAVGTRNGVAVTGVLPTSASPDPADPLTTNDNYLFEDQNYVTFDGLGLTLEGGLSAKLGYGFIGMLGTSLYYDVASDDSFSFAGSAGVSVTRLDTPTDPTPPVASAVPEAASWTMMLFGFGAIGAAMRRASRSGFAPGLI